LIHDFFSELNTTSFTSLTAVFIVVNRVSISDWKISLSFNLSKVPGLFVQVSNFNI